MWKKYSSLLNPIIKRWLTVSFLLSSIEAIPVLAITFFIQHALNQTIPKGNVKMLIVDGMAILFATFAIALLALLNSKIAIKINHKIGCFVYERIIEKALKLGVSAGPEDPGPSILHDADKFHSMGTLILIRSMPSIFVSLAISAFLFWINSYLALFLFLGVPFFLFGSHSIEKKMKEFGGINFQSHQKFNEGIRFLFDMRDLIQTQTAEEIEAMRQKENLRAMEFNLRQFIWHQTFYYISQNFLISTISIAILIAGGFMVIRGSMLWGHLISFYVAVGMLKRYVQVLIGSIPMMLEGDLSFKRIDAFLKKKEAPVYQGTKKLDFQGDLCLQEVSFRFSEEPLLEKVSFAIKKGEIAAVLGPNGSGKSTLANLILGFLRPNSGDLFFDGTPIHTLDLAHLRKQTAILRQNPQLFSGTIKENIFYGSSHSVLELEMFEKLLSFVREFPLGWETPVGPSGLPLSGGQKQKLALVRALVRKPKLLILDEPTNHLDAASLEQIFGLLQIWKQHMAILLISHHPDLFRFVDRIYKLDRARTPACMDLTFSNQYGAYKRSLDPA